MTKALLYSHFGRDPWFNMAFDEWMLSEVIDQSCRAGLSSDLPQESGGSADGPTLQQPGLVILRLYTWDRDTITFGHHQRREKALDFSILGDTPAIRRVTGGRALLHDPSELTYSITANLPSDVGSPLVDSPLAGSLASVSKAIALALQVFLKGVEITAEYARSSHEVDRDPAALHSVPCFASHSRHELAAGGRKIVASAQRRIGDAFLQHGSIKLNGVSQHPALGGKPLDNRELHSGLSSVQFDGLAEIFLSTTVSHLALDPCHAELSEAQFKQIQTASTAIRKKPLECRESLNSTTSLTVY